jgi:hypothetical protein
MISVNGTSYNGANGNVTYLPCSSDYEERPLVNVTPKAPKPGWRDQHAIFTHHLQWVDHEGISHGLTLGSDSLQDLLADLRLIKQMIRQAKQTSSMPVSQASEAPELDNDIPPCKIHGAPMQRKQSKRTGGIYCSHRLPSGELCFGKSKA